MAFNILILCTLAGFYSIFAYFFFFPSVVFYLFKNTKWSRKTVRLVAFCITPWLLLVVAFVLVGAGMVLLVFVILLILAFACVAMLYSINNLFRIGEYLKKWMRISTRILTVVHRLLELLIRGFGTNFFGPTPGRAKYSSTFSIKPKR